MSPIVNPPLLNTEGGRAPSSRAQDSCSTVLRPPYKTRASSTFGPFKSNRFLCRWSPLTRPSGGNFRNSAGFAPYSSKWLKFSKIDSQELRFEFSEMTSSVISRKCLNTKGYVGTEMRNHCVALFLTLETNCIMQCAAVDDKRCVYVQRCIRCNLAQNLNLFCLYFRIFV